MRKRLLPWLLFGVFLALTSSVQAQITNLLHDGAMEVKDKVGGEPVDRPFNWYFKSSFHLNERKLSPEYKRDNSLGSYGLMVTPTSDAFELRNAGGTPETGREDYRMTLKPNTEYKYSFWVKSEHGKGKINIVIEFGRRPWSKSKTNDPLIAKEGIVTTTEWTEVTGTFTSPSHEEVKNSQFIFSLQDGIWDNPSQPGQSITEKYYFDDASLVEVGTSAGGSTPSAPATTLKKPLQLAAKTQYQRALEMSWSANGNPDDVEWEIRLDGADPIATISGTTTYTITNLKPDTRYKVGVRAKKGNEVSEWHETDLNTTPIKIEEANPHRTPYLVGLTTYGQTRNQVLPIIIENLYGDNPTIEYLLDGNKITPQSDGTLYFEWKTPEGEYYQKHILELLINEGNGKNFRLTYYLTVRKGEPKGKKSANSGVEVGIE